MSKSRNNAIAIGASEDQTARLIRAAKTDSDRRITYDPIGRPEVSNLLLLAALCLEREPRDVAEEIGGGGAAARRAAGRIRLHLDRLLAAGWPPVIITGMCDDNENNESFEDMVRSFAREVGRSAERMTQLDVDELAESIGIDPERAREWADTASQWLRGQVETLGDDLAARAGAAAGAAGGATKPAAPHHADPLSSAAPHPLDVPTEEQGIALAALHSGRWTVEPGSNALAGHGDGPAPNNALGLVRELHVRDWIDSSGQVTLVGRHALSRWLDATGAR